MYIFISLTAQNLPPNYDKEHLMILCNFHYGGKHERTVVISETNVLHLLTINNSHSNDYTNPKFKQTDDVTANYLILNNQPMM